MRTTNLESWAGRRGYRIAWGPASVLEEVRGTLDEMRKDGRLESGFADYWLSSFSYLDKLRFPTGTATALGPRTVAPEPRWKLPRPAGLHHPGVLAMAEKGAI